MHDVADGGAVVCYFEKIARVGALSASPVPAGISRNNTRKKDELWLSEFTNVEHKRTRVKCG